MTPLLSPWWLLVFSLFLLTLRGLYSLGLRIAAKRSMTGDTRHGPVTRAVRTIDPAILALFWFSFGAAVMDYQLHLNTKTKKDVLIMSRRSENRFHVFTPTNGNGEFELVTCAPADFQEGEKLIFLTYEQQTGCSNIRGIGRGFKAYTDSAGKRIKFPIKQEIADVR